LVQKTIWCRTETGAAREPISFQTFIQGSRLPPSIFSSIFSRSSNDATA
jgi:hypothetical protein